MTELNRFSKGHVVSQLANAVTRSERTVDSHRVPTVGSTEPD